MKGATPVAWAKKRINPKIKSNTINGIKNQSFAFHKNSISSLDSLILEKKFLKKRIAIYISSFKTMQFSRAKISNPDFVKVFSASCGELTIGSPFRLNDVFNKT